MKTKKSFMTSGRVFVVNFSDIESANIAFQRSIASLNSRSTIELPLSSNSVNVKGAIRLSRDEINSMFNKAYVEVIEND